MVNPSFVSQVENLSNLIRFKPPIPSHKDPDYVKKMESSEPSEKIMLATERRIGFWLDFANKNNSCLQCWIKRDACLCDSLPLFYPKHRVLVYMHYKEFFRSSNSGKLLLNCLKNSELFISGLESHENRLQNIVDKEGDRTFILYPSADAISLEDFIKQHERNLEQHNNDTDDNDNHWCETTTNSTIPSFNIIVLDGTWSQARSLQRRLPHHITRVVVPFNHRSLFSPLRNQAGDGRISTFETAMTAIKIMDHDTEMWEQMMYHFKRMIDTVLLQASQATVYGTIPSKQEKKNRSEKLGTKEKSFTHLH
eukprot:gb/GECH01011657.1/.p1 GENE.gb/GECH01011657.1/~~gb/GECH01011657.1/.p1  ORF type:complete len:309 (+),score=45.03 gb/GECH01011657.1/:1-927(+)